MAMKKLRTVAIAACLAFVATGASAALINADFETGDLSGWSVTPTATGTTLVQTVSNAETVLGTISNAGHFNVGRQSGTYDGYQGINLSQTFMASAGVHTFSVDVAVQTQRYGNAHAALFRLYAGATLLDTIDFGSIGGSTAERGTLSGSVSLSAGLIDFRIEILRRYATSTNTPQQYVDNASVVAPVPVPASLALMLVGFGAIGALKRRKHV